MSKIRVGMEVGGERWGMSHAHPSVWMKPWKGTVLACDDTRAWDGTIAMGGKKATKQKVKEHLEYFEREGTPICGKGKDVPVLWHFDDGNQAFWEPVKKLRPYREDVAKWKLAKEKAKKKWEK